MPGHAYWHQRSEPRGKDACSGRSDRENNQTERERLKTIMIGTMMGMLLSAVWMNFCIIFRVQPVAGFPATQAK